MERTAQKTCLKNWRFHPLAPGIKESVDKCTKKKKIQYQNEVRGRRRGRELHGGADDKFGKRVSNEKPELSMALRNLAKTTSATTQYSWIVGLLLSKDLPTAQSWVTKYGSKPLLYT